VHCAPALEWGRGLCVGSLDTHEWSTVITPYHMAVIAAIRERDAKNLVVAGTQTWSQDADKAAADPSVADKNELEAGPSTSLGTTIRGVLLAQDSHSHVCHTR
jgi:hypothetical protein